MAHKLKRGRAVEFHPASHPALTLRGTITAVSADHDLVTIKAIADGKVVEVAREFDAHVKDVTVLDDAPEDSETTEEK